jgi:hypothetical protein
MKRSKIQEPPLRKKMHEPRADRDSAKTDLGPARERPLDTKKFGPASGTIYHHRPYRMARAWHP